MRRWRLLAGALGVALVGALAVGLRGREPSCAAQQLVVFCSENSTTIPPYEVFELTFRHEREYENPFFDVDIEVTFRAPSGKVYRIGGFHYGSTEKPKIRAQRDSRGRAHVTYLFKKRNLWKARFAPTELGRWSYRWRFANAQGEAATGEGTFLCVKNRAYNPGFVRQNPNNPFRWVFDDGTPYFPIGLQNGYFDNSATGTGLDTYALEGPFRLDRAGRPAPPPGAMFKPGPSYNPLNADIYFRRYSRCGFNIVRFSQQNFSLPLYTDLDHYLTQEAIAVDDLLRCARKYGFRIFYGIFGYKKVFNNEPDNAEGMAKVKRFLRYTVNRWAAYVDFWEFLNEQNADDKWYAIMAPYLRSLDPYKHPIATSWERPQLAGIDVCAPHWYAGITNELSCDAETAGRAARWKKFGKPVIVGEHGNSTPRNKPKPPGVGGVWDPKSALRMRIRNWAAFFNEISFIFWNTSYAKDGHFMNIWLGPREREYVRALQDFAYRLDCDIRMVPVEVSQPKLVRVYGLASAERAAVYLHHYKDHTTPVRGVSVTLNVPKAATAYWYSTETAAILKTVPAPAGRQTFVAPEFVVDIALLITPDGPPDIDHDGTPNDLDPDDDNDGVPDAKDAFPLEPEEWEDKDGDLIGDVLDADVDADGLGDDKNKNGIADHEERDIDGDGVPRSRAVPWDAFPFNPKEWRDTDGDGIGDNADEDDDGDGFTDAEERRAGTDPLDKLSFPVGQ